MESKRSREPTKLRCAGLCRDILRKRCGVLLLSIIAGRASPHHITSRGNSDLRRRAMQGEIRIDRRRRSSNLKNEETTIRR
ncbi:hypothetical protein SLA2020_307590 [Shorea laevis]